MLTKVVRTNTFCSNSYEYTSSENTITRSYVPNYVRIRTNVRLAKKLLSLHYLLHNFLRSEVNISQYSG